MEEILPPVIIEILSKAQKVFMDNGIEYFIVGAIARDIQLAKILGHASPRITKDVDFAVMVPDESAFNIIKAAMAATGEFTIDKNNPLKLVYKQRIEIDLMPFGDIENNMREISLQNPKVFAMDVPGFREVHSFLEHIQLGKESFCSCSVEGLILLKLYAWNDRPSRNKDLQDIELLLSRYIDISDNVYEAHFDVLNMYNETLQTYLVSVSGRVIGREMARLLSYNKEKIQTITAILAKRPVIGWLEMAAGLQDPSIFHDVIDRLTRFVG